MSKEKGIKEEIKEELKEAKEEVKEEVQEAKEKVKKAKDKVETKVEKSGVKKFFQEKKNITIIAIIAALILIFVLVILYKTSPRARVNGYLHEYAQNPAKTLMKYMPNKKFSEEKNKVLNSRTKRKIKKLDKINKDKFKVKVEVKGVNSMKASEQAFEKAKKDDKYVKNAESAKDKKNNNDIELKYLKEVVKDADIETNEYEFTMYKEESGAWVVENRGLLDD